MQDNQPDWHKIAEKFDLWLPYIKPVGDDLLQALNAKPGDKILDVASGTGEPALTLARQMGNAVDITGIDAAAGMIGVAQAKVKQEQLTSIRFITMPVEAMTFNDSQYDKLLCRFGVMLFEDPLAGVKEMHRVLKPGGSFSLAVWGAEETMLTLYWAYETLKDTLPEDLHPPLKKVTSMGAPGIISSLLSDAGFVDLSVERKTFYYEFAAFDDYWGTVEASDIMKVQFDALGASGVELLKAKIQNLAKPYCCGDRYRVPHEYLLVSGKK